MNAITLTLLLNDIIDFTAYTAVAALFSSPILALSAYMTSRNENLAHVSRSLADASLRAVWIFFGLAFVALLIKNI